jgi:effector-binding domain-containing protein
MDYLLGTHEVGPQRIASIRSRCNQAALPGFIKTGMGELLETLRALDVDPCGPPFVIYHDFGAGGIDAEVSVPIGAPITPAGRIATRIMPTMTVARAVHVGPYEDLRHAYSALWKWIRCHELETAGPIQERYLNGPGDTLTTGDYRTEIEMSVVPMVVAAPV